MQDTDLLLSLAEIAGVFVGFGALIAVRSAGASTVAEVAYIRGVVSMGMLAVVAALAPVILGRYGLAAHEVWALSALLVLAGWIVMLVAMVRTREYRANWSAEYAANRTSRPGWVLGIEGILYVLYLAGTVLVPVVVALGLLPALEAALYVSVVVIVLLGAGWTLLALVFSQRSAEERAP